MNRIVIERKGITLELEGLGYGDVRVTARKGPFTVQELVGRADVERLEVFLRDHLASSRPFGDGAR